MNIDRLEYVRNIVASAVDFDYTDMRLCVAGHCHKHFGHAGQNQIEFATAYLELTEPEAAYLFFAAMEDGSMPDSTDAIYAGQVDRAEALRRIDYLISQVLVTA